jgi:hypothetical protein
MEWHSVPSSTLERVSYDPRSMTLTVEFKSGTAYQYFDVPDQVFNNLLSASSPGQYLAQNVKSAYRYARM